MSEIREKILKSGKDYRENTLLNNPNISIEIPGFKDISRTNSYKNNSKRNDQYLYDKAIEIGLKNNTIEKKVKNGKVYYEIKYPITYRTQDKNITGKFVLTEVHGKKRLFVVRPESKAVGVPFGEFANIKNKSPFDYIIENKKIQEQGNNERVFIHRHLRSSGKNSYMTKEMMKEVTKYYSNYDNAQKITEAILTYLRDKENTLDEVSNNWSGSGLNKAKFGTEIQAHADMLLDEKIFTKLLKIVKTGIDGLSSNIPIDDVNFLSEKTIGINYSKKINEETERKYYNSAGMADMAKGDRGINKKMMDLLWQEKKTDIKNKFDLERSR